MQCLLGPVWNCGRNRNIPTDLFRLWILRRQQAGLRTENSEQSPGLDGVDKKHPGTVKVLVHVKSSFTQMKEDDRWLDYSKEH